MSDPIRLTAYYKKMGNERWIEVRQVRVDEVVNLSNKRAFWVEYSVVASDGDAAWIEHMGERLITAIDELGFYQEFPKQMHERHNIDPNNVRWKTGEASE